MSSPLQHYVPHFMLKRFGRGKTHQVHVFDKSTGMSFSRAANQLAAERKFYDFEFLGFPMSLEQSLAELESEAAQCIETILQRGQLAVEEPEIIEERPLSFASWQCSWCALAELWRERMIFPGSSKR
jgi:hypothetical protein